MLQDIRGCDGHIPPVREGGQGGTAWEVRGDKGRLSALPRAPGDPGAQCVKSRVLAAFGRVPNAPKHRVLISDPLAVYLAQPHAARGGASLGRRVSKGAVGGKRGQVPRIAMY